MPRPAVKRTYGSSRSLRPTLPSSPISSYSSDPLVPEDASLKAFQLEVEIDDSSSLPPSSPARPTSPLVPSSPTRVTGKRKRDTPIGAENDRNSPIKNNVTTPKPMRVNLMDYLVPKARSTPSLPITKNKTSKNATMARPTPKKRPMASSESDLFSNTLPSTSPSSSRTPKYKHSLRSTPSTSATKKLKQMHLSLGQKTSAIRTCPLCSLSYTLGTVEDEELHKKHCARIVRGSEWGKEESRFEGGVVTVVEDGIIVKSTNGNGKVVEEKGRIVSFKADLGGKLGAKVCLLRIL